MKDLKEKMFGTDLLIQYIHFPEYKEIYTMMKPDFSKIASTKNKKQIEDNILEFQDRTRLFIAEYHFLKSIGLEEKIQDITNYTLNFKNYEEDFHKKLDQSFYNNMKYTCYNSFEECDTLADKLLHRIFTIQNLLEHYVNNENDKYLKNEIKNFHTLGMVIINYFLSEDLLRYMELATRDQTTERYNNSQLFQQLSEFANFYLSETNEYNKMYNETINKKSEVKQFKKTLAKSNQE